MANIRCPHCGSPVTVRGNQWECGWCGDSGALSSLHKPELAKLHQNQAAAVALEDLECGVLSIMNGMQEHFGDGENERLLAFQLVVYGMSHALLPAENQSQTNLQLLQQFFDAYPVCTAAEVLGASRSGTAAFADQFLLTKDALGSFWEELLPKLPHYEAHKAWPDWLYDTVDGLSQVECIFSGENSSALFDTYQEALDTHWSVYPILHPDRAALEDAVRRWDFSENEWVCRDLLIAAFPEAVKHWSANELLDMTTVDILAETGTNDPDTAIQMMKLLLDAAENHLQDPEAAEQLLGNDLYDLYLDQSVQSKLLERLKTDDHLAQQFFLSAYAGSPQEGLLEACDQLGESALKKHLQELLAQNPYFEGFD